MKRLMGFALIASVVGVLAFGPSTAAIAAKPQPTSSVLTVPFSGSVTNELGQLINYSGTFTLQKFVIQNGQLMAVGTVTATATNTVTGAVDTVTKQVTIPVTASGSCQILHLELGPINLDLLGLQITTNKIVLDITAQSGPGNLLGNLLCGIAGLLDSNTINGALVNLLNQLLALLK